MLENSISERRRSIRIKDLLPTEIHFIKGQPIKKQATIQNISDGGVCITTSIDNNKVEKELYIKIKLPGCSVLDIAGVVIWKIEKAKELLMLGIKFSNVSITVKSQINKYIQSRIQNRQLSKIKRTVFDRHNLNKLSERGRRNLIILNGILKKGPISKAEVAQVADLNIGTITNYIESYIKKGLVLEVGLDISSGGRRPTLLELNPSYGYCVGMDISNTKEGLIIVISDIKGRVINKHILTLHPKDDLRVNDVAQQVSKLFLDASISQELLLGVGIAVGDTGNKDFLDLSYVIEKEFNVPVLIENFCAANLYVEKMTNQNVYDCDNVLYFSIYASDCSLIINGDICRMNSKFALNIDNKNINSSLACWTKQRKCLFYPLFEHCQEDTDNLPVLLGTKLSLLTNMLSPDMIILGDVDNKEIVQNLLSQIRDILKDGMINNTQYMPKVVIEHFGKESAALGVALLVAREVFIQA